MIYPKVEVHSSGIHNKGVFARQDIKKGKYIIEYIGEKISKKEGDKRSDDQITFASKNQDAGAVYIFELDKVYDIDGNIPENDAKYINHSCEPNCTIHIRKGKIWVVAIRDIKEGEELSYNYSYDWDDYQDHPCRCGSKKCVGYILDDSYWKKLQKIKDENSKTA